MKIGPGGLFKISYIFGSKIVPKLMKLIGAPENACGYGNLWTGFLLGAGGALIALGTIIGLVSGGAIVAPAVVSSAVLHGAIGAAATAIGFGLLRAGEEALGYSFVSHIKDLVKFLQSPPAVGGTVIKLPDFPAPLKIMPAAAFMPLGENFANAVKPAASPVLALRKRPSLTLQR